MRYSEFISEGSLSAPELNKSPDRLQTFVDKIATRSPFELTNKQTVIIDPSEAARMLQLINSNRFAGAISLKTEDGDVISIKSLQKTPEFGSTGGENKLANRGEIAEGILGAAMFAKLTSRMNGTIGVVNPSDVWGVIDSLKVTNFNTGSGKTAASGEYQTVVKDHSKKVVNDEVVFTLRLKGPAYADILDKTKRHMLSDLVLSAIAYANSARANKFSEHFFLNGKPDIINVISDGVSGEGDRKTDVEVYVTDRITGEKNMYQLNISLKVDSDQVGQVGGWKFEKMQALWNHLAINVDAYKPNYDEILKSEGPEAAVESTYRTAATILDDLLTGIYDQEEYKYIQELVKGINFFSTFNDPSVEVVSFGTKGKYKVMKFDKLEDKLKDIELTAKYIDTAARPQVDIFDANTGQLFLRIRHKIEKGGATRRNLIEKGPLLSELTDITD